MDTATDKNKNQIPRDQRLKRQSKRNTLLSEKIKSTEREGDKKVPGEGKLAVGEEGGDDQR